MSRISFVTENTIDVASDVNESLREVDGIISMVVESIGDIPVTPDDGKYYAINTGVNKGKVAKWVATGSFYEYSSPAIIVYNGGLYIIISGDWVKVSV